jgi:translation initiation factor IF-1
MEGVREVLPDRNYRVLHRQRSRFAYAAGKMSKFKIRAGGRPSDGGALPYLTRGRVVYRPSSRGS